MSDSHHRYILVRDPTGDLRKEEEPQMGVWKARRIIGKRKLSTVRWTDLRPKPNNESPSIHRMRPAAAEQAAKVATDPELKKKFEEAAQQAIEQSKSLIDPEAHLHVMSCPK